MRWELLRLSQGEQKRAFAEQRREKGCMENEHQWTREELRRSLDLLTERERQIMTLRFGLVDEQDRTREQVGRMFKITRDRVRRIEESAWSKLKKAGPDGEAGAFVT